MNRKKRGRGEGSISFRKASNRWEGKITVGEDGNGRRIRRAVYGDTKKEVQDKLAELRAKVGTFNAQFVPTKMTLQEYLISWLETTARPATSPTTWTRYRSLCRLHISEYIGGVRLLKLNPGHVRHLMAELETRGAPTWTRKMALTVLHNALANAVASNLIPHNPAANISKPKPAERRIEFLSQEQVKTFLHAASKRRLSALFHLAVGSGMRQGEILGLEWPDIDLEKATVTIRRSLIQPIKVSKKEPAKFQYKEPKSRASRRTISLPGFVVNALRLHRHAMLREGNIAGNVFCTKTGQPIEATNLIRQVLRPILKDAALPRIRFHDLRHTHASLLLANGENIKAVSQRLGHGSIEITLKVYVHLLPGNDEALSNRLQKMFG